MLGRTASVFFLGSVLICAGGQVPQAAVPDQAERVGEVRDSQASNASSAVLLQPTGTRDSSSKQSFTRVTIKQLRSDPKGYAQQNVAVSGQIGEVSQAEKYLELAQNGESLRVLVDGLPPSVQAKLYAAKSGSRVTAFGQFSGYVLFAARVEFGK